MIISETTIQNATLINTFVPNVTLEYIVVGGGGGGGYDAAGGGGGGGVLAGSAQVFSAPAAYPVTVGTGGAGRGTAPSVGVSGLNSTCFGLTAAGGGGG